jgi:pyrroloquinoline quinone (PQQ) biosynthesis protein C
LNAVIHRLDNPEHQGALLQNLSEESGIYPEEDLTALAAAGIEADWIIGVPHPQLFQRFQAALGITKAELEQPEPEVIHWRHQLLMFLSNGSAAEAIGAIGLGTESIVSACYRPILAAIAQLDDVSAQDAVFFSMHTIVDDAHQDTLLDIAIDLAQTPQGWCDLKKGMNKALTLRARFWDWMYHRALTQEKIAA